MTNKRILIPLPHYGFDPTEVAIPWKILSENKIDIIFATPSGLQASADSKMLKGEHLGVWRRLLQARHDAVFAYSSMEQSTAFRVPISYSEMHSANADGILLPGGHDKAVKEYLESKILHDCIVQFFAASKPVAAICHGVVAVARSIDPTTNASVLHSYKTTSLLKVQELAAYNLTRLWLGDYYLTYPEITVEEEVTAALVDPNNFLKGKQPRFRDDAEHLERGFSLRDRNYLSARWPGDAYSFSLAFIAMLQE
jgi:protease I